MNKITLIYSNAFVGLFGNFNTLSVEIFTSCATQQVYKLESGLLHYYTMQLGRWLHTLSKYTPPPSSLQDRGDEAGGSRLLFSRCTNEDPQISGATIQNFVAQVTSCLEFAYSCSKMLTISPPTKARCVITQNTTILNFTTDKNYKFNLNA